MVAKFAVILIIVGGLLFTGFAMARVSLIGKIGNTGSGLYPSGPEWELSGPIGGLGGGGGGACGGQLDFSNSCNMVYIPALIH